MSGITFGKKISASQADDHFDLVMQIKKNSHEILKKHIKDDAKSRRYYCGREEDANTDLCYLFSKEILVELLKKIEDNQGHGVAIFNGGRFANDTELDVNEKADIDGRPTVMIFPFKKTGIKAPNFDDEITIINDGYEHPGTGGKPGGKDFEPAKDGKYKLPLSFKRHEIYKFNQ